MKLCLGRCQWDDRWYQKNGRVAHLAGSRDLALSHLDRGGGSRLDRDPIMTVAQLTLPILAASPSVCQTGVIPLCMEGHYLGRILRSEGGLSAGRDQSERPRKEC